MIKLYLTSSCGSCRKARKWLIDNQLEYQEINLATGLNRASLIEILSLTEGGTGDILSVQSDLYKELNLDFSKMRLEQFLKTIEAYPLLLKRPIIIDENNIQVGFNEDDIRKFLPREFREIQRSGAYSIFLKQWLESLA